MGISRKVVRIVSWSLHKPACALRRSVPFRHEHLDWYAYLLYNNSSLRSISSADHFGHISETMENDDKYKRQNG